MREKEGGNLNLYWVGGAHSFLIGHTYSNMAGVSYINLLMFVCICTSCSVPAKCVYTLAPCIDILTSRYSSPAQNMTGRRAMEENRTND